MCGEVSIMPAESIDQCSDKSKHFLQGHTTVVVDSTNDIDVKSQPSRSFRGDNGYGDRTPKPALHPKNSFKANCAERHSAIASSGLSGGDAIKSVCIRSQLREILSENGRNLADFIWLKIVPSDNDISRPIDALETYNSGKEPHLCGESNAYLADSVSFELEDFTCWGERGVVRENQKGNFERSTDRNNVHSRK